MSTVTPEPARWENRVASQVRVRPRYQACFLTVVSLTGSRAAIAVAAFSAARPNTSMGDWPSCTASNRPSCGRGGRHKVRRSRTVTDKG